MILASDFQPGIRYERVAGLGNPAFAVEHLACEDQRLRAGSALGEAAVHQQLVSAGPQERIHRKDAEKEPIAPRAKRNLRFSAFSASLRQMFLLLH
jgi:hypothetical protein